MTNIELVTDAVRPSRASLPSFPSTTSICCGAWRSGPTCDPGHSSTLWSSTRRRSSTCWPAWSRACSGRSRCASVVHAWTRLPSLARAAAGDAFDRPGAHPARGRRLIAVKHQSMFETLEMVRLAHTPVIVLKRELSAIPGSAGQRGAMASFQSTGRPAPRPFARWSPAARKRGSGRPMHHLSGGHARATGRGAPAPVRICRALQGTGPARVCLWPSTVAGFWGPNCPRAGEKCIS